ncbi:MAG: hypothetical protein KGY54_01350 [Oleiphilaceae bacterium]|nr:hypothetical protein [Oleiphilaceae bacterium]
MTKLYLYPALLLSVLALAGCSKPQTPQEVTEVFWQAVVTGDAGEVVEHSTLEDETEFDGFSQDWVGVTPELGRVVIEDRKAWVVTRFEGLAHSGEQANEKPAESATYLLKVNDQWLVDYERTAEALAERPVFEKLMDELETFGDKVKEGLSGQSGAAARKLEEIAQEFEQLSDLAGERLSELSEEYGDNIKQSLEELSRSIREALKEKDSEPPKSEETRQEAALDSGSYNAVSA